MSEQQRPVSEIARLNDEFRHNTSGRNVVITPGVQEIPTLGALLMVVRSFDDFNEDNDPYGEHDFGAFDWEQDRIFFKIDYYDQQLQGWEDPLSSACRRVMTVMTAEEY